jgi:hypothetical protein
LFLYLSVCLNLSVGVLGWLLKGVNVLVLGLFVNLTLSQPEKICFILRDCT